MSNYELLAGTTLLLAIILLINWRGLGEWLHAWALLICVFVFGGWK